MNIVSLLRRLKCRLVGHAFDHYCPDAWTQTGAWYCGRCKRPIRGEFGPLPPRLYAHLKKLGWTREDIQAIGDPRIPGEDIVRFMKAMYESQTLPQANVMLYERGYTHGYERGALEGFPGDLSAAHVALGDGKMGIFPGDTK